MDEFSYGIFKMEQREYELSISPLYKYVAVTHLEWVRTVAKANTMVKLTNFALPILKTHLSIFD